MGWWKTALYDTCSLITLDRLLQDRPTLSRWFPKKVLALEASLSVDQMCSDTIERVKGVVQLCPLPTPTKLERLQPPVKVFRALSEVDKLVFAAAVHSRLAVVTVEERLARAIQQRGLEVGNLALILRQLVETKRLKASSVTKLLQGLADRKDLLLGMSDPTWENLEDYTFPDRRPARLAENRAGRGRRVAGR